MSVISSFPPISVPPLPPLDDDDDTPASLSRHVPSAHGKRKICDISYGENRCRVSNTIEESNANSFTAKLRYLQARVWTDKSYDGKRRLG